MSTNDDVPTYQYLRRNLPREPMTPSAPQYDAIPCAEDLHGITRNFVKEELLPLRASVPSPNDDTKKKLRIEAEIKKAQLRKEQLMRERQIMEEEFKAKEMLIDAETEFVLTSMDSAEEGPSSCITINGVNSEVGNKTVNFNAHSRVLHTGQTNDGKIERPFETSQPTGLEQLGSMDCLSIRQMVSNALDESYEVVAPGNVVIFHAKLSFDLANTGLIGQRTCLRVAIFDNEGNQLINFRSEPSGYVELFVNRQLACLIRKALTWVKPVLMIHDANGWPALKVKGPGKGSDRNVCLVQTVQKRNIGSVDKTPMHLGSDFMADNHTAVKFPQDLDVRLKAAIIASSFLLVPKKIVKHREEKIRHAIYSDSTRYLRNGHYEE